MKKRNLTLLTAFAAAVAFASTAQADVTLSDGHTGDYRIAFATDRFASLYVATSADITTYDSAVTAAAAASGGYTTPASNPLGAADLSDIVTTWKCIGSTSAKDAKDNTDTATTGGATDVPIYNIWGDRIADNNADFWDGSLANNGIVQLNRKFSEQGIVFTGTQANGTAAAGKELGAATVAHGTCFDTGNAMWRFNSATKPQGESWQLYGMSGVLGGGTTPAADPAITSITVAGGIATIIMKGTDGTNYTCKSSTTLDDGFPTTETTTPASPITTTGGTATFTVPASEAKKFYVVGE